MTTREIVVAADQDQAAARTAVRFAAFAEAHGLLRVEHDPGDLPEAHIAVSGGSIATAVLPAIVAEGERVGIDWSRIHVWFADERFAPRGHDDRNAAAVAAVLRSASGFVPTQLHPTLSSELGMSLDEAAAAYEQEIRVNVQPANREPGALPSFDLILLGSGPDGHVASLFPGREAIALERGVVTAVEDSPKPPPRRLTLTLPAIRSAARVWAVVTGSGKADAVALAVRDGVPASESPLGAVSGRLETLLVVDEAAAAGIPD